MYQDFSWPSVYFAYLFFAILFSLAAYFLWKTRGHGYWGRHSEDAKFRMLNEE